MSIILKCDWCKVECFDSDKPDSFKDHDMRSVVKDWAFNTYAKEPNRCPNCEAAWFAMQNELRLATELFRAKTIGQLKMKYLKSLPKSEPIINFTAHF